MPRIELIDCLPARSLTEAQAALAARCSIPAVRQLLVDRHALIRSLLRDGWSHAELAKLLGTSRQRIHQLLNASRVHGAPTQG